MTELETMLAKLQNAAPKDSKGICRRNDAEVAFWNFRHELEAKYGTPNGATAQEAAKLATLFENTK